MRKQNRLALKSELEAVLSTKPAHAWAEELNRIGVPSGAVLSVPEVLAMPQIADRGFLHRFPNAPGVGRDITVATTGIKLDGQALSVDTPPPTLGAHNDAVWTDLGLTPEELDALKQEGVI